VTGTRHPTVEEPALITFKGSFFEDPAKLVVTAETKEDCLAKTKGPFTHKLRDAALR